MPASVDPAEIKSELIATGYPVRKVKQLTKFENNVTSKLPLFILELDNSDKGREIYDLKRLLYMVVSVEAYKPRSGMKQCYRCQRFNHTFPGCSLTPRCLHCSDKHQHKDCPIKVAAKNDNYSNVQTARRLVIQHQTTAARATWQRLLNTKSQNQTPDQIQTTKNKPLLEKLLIHGKLQQACHLALQ